MVGWLAARVSADRPLLTPAACMWLLYLMFPSQDASAFPGNFCTSHAHGPYVSSCHSSSYGIHHRMSGLDASISSLDKKMSKKSAVTIPYIHGSFLDDFESVLIDGKSCMIETSKSMCSKYDMTRRFGFDGNSGQQIVVEFYNDIEKQKLHLLPGFIKSEFSPYFSNSETSHSVDRGGDQRYIEKSIGGRKYMLQKGNTKTGNYGQVRFGYDKGTLQPVAVKMLFTQRVVQFPKFRPDAILATIRGQFKTWCSSCHFLMGAILA
jgi:hypothetical protein